MSEQPIKKPTTYHILTDKGVRISTRSRRVFLALLQIPGNIETTGPGKGNWGNPNSWHKDRKKEDNFDSATNS